LESISRLFILEKKGRKEVYYDRQTGQKIKVEREIASCRPSIRRFGSLERRPTLAGLNRAPLV
jgi:hypothetical protein